MCTSTMLFKLGLFSFRTVSVSRFRLLPKSSTDLYFSPQGNILGSVLGGRWSDHVLRQWKPSIEHGGQVPPEVSILTRRLERPVIQFVVSRSAFEARYQPCFFFLLVSSPMLGSLRSVFTSPLYVWRCSLSVSSQCTSTFPVPGFR